MVVNDNPHLAIDLPSKTFHASKFAFSEEKYKKHKTHTNTIYMKNATTPKYYLT